MHNYYCSFPSVSIRINFSSLLQHHHPSASQQQTQLTKQVCTSTHIYYFLQSRDWATRKMQTYGSDNPMPSQTLIDRLLSFSNLHRSCHRLRLLRQVGCTRLICASVPETCNHGPPAEFHKKSLLINRSNLSFRFRPNIYLLPRLTSLPSGVNSNSRLN